MIDPGKKREKLILVGIESGGPVSAEESLNELRELVEGAGAEVVGTELQTRDSFHPATYMGTGKIEEVRMLLAATGADGIVADDELTATQMKNLEDQLSTIVLDRTVVILDIFARRASTSEGKLQVELAQARYSMTRLSGYGKTMSRLGGGIGTRGPGESKLETDRRRIRTRITHLKEELEAVDRRREVNRSLRGKNHLPVIAIVGYTNAGKSTLLNTLTHASVLSEDRLFATLDPTTRACLLPSGQKVLLTDTVGFIRKLPHHLIDAFRSTLEEARYADIITHVVDASNPEYGHQMDVVYETLRDLNISGKPVVTLFNKVDLLRENLDQAGLVPCLRDPKADRSLQISAATGEGLDRFLKTLEEMLNESSVSFEKVYPYEEAGKIQLIRTQGRLLEEIYQEDGIHVKAQVPVEILKLI